MNKNELVTLRQGLAVLDYNGIQFKANKFYRCDVDTGFPYIIFGTNVSQDVYENCFETAHARVLRDFKTLSLIDNNNKPISKTLFKSAFFQQVFRGRNRVILYVYYFYTHPKELCYAFYPDEDKKPTTITQCYNWFLELVNGNMESLDSTDVVFGNSGLPIGNYAQIYAK